MKGRSRFRFRYRGIMGALAQTLSSLFDKILNDEETAGNDNVFYNPQDLTSLRVGTDGSGGSPAVGDPVGMMLDTSGLSGSMEEFLSSQTELVTNGTFDTDTSGWGHNNTSGTSTFSVTGGEATFTRDAFGDSFYQTDVAPAVAGVYLLTLDITAISGGGLRYSFSPTSAANPSNQVTASSVGSYSTAFVSDGTLLDFVFDLDTNGASVTIDNISVKELPGNHAIAPTDPARPILMDDPDTTWASLTDDGTRGPELVTNGGFDTDSDWTKVLGATIADSVAHLPGGGGQVNQSAGTLLEIGAEYEVTYTSSNKTGAGSTRIGFGGVNGTLRSGEGTYTETIRAISTGNTVVAYLGGSSLDNVDIDNISVRKVNTAFDERGGELVTNGTFDTDSDWTLINGSIIGVSMLVPLLALKEFSKIVLHPLAPKHILLSLMLMLNQVSLHCICV